MYGVQIESAERSVVLLKCSKCDGYLEATPAYKDWKKSGRSVLCPDCWPPIKEPQLESS